MATKICPDCGATIDVRERICPRCNGRQHMKLGMLGRLAIGIAVLVVIGILVILLRPHGT